MNPNHEGKETNGELALSGILRENASSLQKESEQLKDTLEHALLDLESLKKHLNLGREAPPRPAPSRETPKQFSPPSHASHQQQTASEEGILSKIKTWLLG